jgi:hypothetical protein
VWLKLRRPLLAAAFAAEMQRYGNLTLSRRIGRYER